MNASEETGSYSLSDTGDRGLCFSLFLKVEEGALCGVCAVKPLHATAAAALSEEYKRRPWEGRLRHWASVAQEETALACVDSEVSARGFSSAKAKTLFLMRRPGEQRGAFCFLRYLLCFVVSRQQRTFLFRFVESREGSGASSVYAAEAVAGS